MSNFDIGNFINSLDGFFARNDLAGAGAFLLEEREKVKISGDKKSELTILNEMTGYYRQTGDEIKGTAAINDALILIDEMNMQDKKSAGTIFLNCATTLKSFGRAKEAMPLYEKAEKILRELSGNDLPLMAGLYNNMALAFQDLKDYEKADEYFHLALDICEKESRLPLEKAITLVNLAHLYFDIDNMDVRPTALMEEAAKILENSENEKYPKYAYTCKKCAPSFGFFGFFADEKIIDKKADKIYARA